MIKVFTFIGYGACFMVGLYLCLWVVETFKNANRAHDTTKEFRKMVEDYSKAAWETRADLSKMFEYFEEMKKKYPVEEAKK